MKKERIYRLFTHMPELETERLTLRPLRVSDCEAVYAYSRDPEVTRFLLWSPHPNPEYTRQYLQYIVGRYRLGDFYDWALVRREDARVIGTCGFTTFHFNSDSGEVGYVLARDCWGQGYAAEALNAVLQYGFDTVGLHRIEARFMSGNPASRRVMEKCRMQYEGMQRGSLKVRGQYRDVGICAILEDEWRTPSLSETTSGRKAFGKAL